MKFLPLREFDDVTTALNFDTPDCHVIGGCDLYTTKAAGSDKKLYRSIENSLESQYESLLRLSASLSAPHAGSFSSLNLSRSSPFGPLTQISSRRTFAYLIATLNASHPDYDFSHVLRPSDFRRERNLRSVMNTLDSTLHNLRPRQLNATPTRWSPGISQATSQISGASQVWGPRMWSLIDKEMVLRDCSIYCYAPEEDPYDGEEGAIWSFNYFFFNKARKRVCYIYLRGLSIMSHSPIQRAIQRAIQSPKRSAEDIEIDAGASKRARFWFGDRADAQSTWDDNSEGENQSWDDGAVDVEGVVLDDGDELEYVFVEEEFDGSLLLEGKVQHKVRGISEDIADSMEV